jgi:hypothetical protein
MDENYETESDEPEERFEIEVVDDTPEADKGKEYRAKAGEPSEILGRTSAEDAGKAVFDEISRSRAGWGRPRRGVS